MQGSAGNQKIADNIFAKIDKCSAFIADVSFINGAIAKKEADGTVAPACSGKCTRLSPNPNVMAEWGWALRSVGDDHVVCVLNEETGSIEDLPFDMRGRHVLSYKLVEGGDKTEAKKLLVGKLKEAIRAILELPQTMLDLQFADTETHEPSGNVLSLENVYLSIDFEIPDYRSATDKLGLGGGLRGGTNSDYYREKANYLLAKSMMRPVRLVLQNTGDRLLSNVRFAATVNPSGDDVWVLLEHGIPAIPAKRHDHLTLRTNIQMRDGLANRSLPGDVAISHRGKQCKLDVTFGNLQAKAPQSTEVFYVGSVTEPTLDMAGLLYADELSEPIPASLSINLNTAHQVLTLNELTKNLPGES